MSIDSVLSEAQAVASEFGLRLRFIDLTSNTISLRLYFDVDLFVQIYFNQLKNKLNLAIVFRNKRLFGADAEGGRYHIHPADKPETHIFTDKKKEVREFVIEALKIIEEMKLL